MAAGIRPDGFYKPGWVGTCSNQVNAQWVTTTETYERYDRPTTPNAYRIHMRGKNKIMRKRAREDWPCTHDLMLRQQLRQQEADHAE